jgi:hypothetical protein
MVDDRGPLPLVGFAELVGMRLVLQPIRSRGSLVICCLKLKLIGLNDGLNDEFRGATVAGPL